MLIIGDYPCAVGLAVHIFVTEIIPRTLTICQPFQMIGQGGVARLRLVTHEWLDSLLDNF